MPLPSGVQTGLPKACAPFVRRTGTPPPDPTVQIEFGPRLPNAVIANANDGLPDTYASRRPSGDHETEWLAHTLLDLASRFDRVARACADTTLGCPPFVSRITMESSMGYAIRWLSGDQAGVEKYDSLSAISWRGPPSAGMTKSLPTSPILSLSIARNASCVPSGDHDGQRWTRIDPVLTSRASPPDIGRT